LAFYVNTSLSVHVLVSATFYSRYFAPFVEETIKISFLYLLIKKNKIGFMIDGAITGFAIGAGFALVENTYYWNVLGPTSIWIWVIRGLGTAVMHGGVVATAGIVFMAYSGEKGKRKTIYYLAGFILAVAIHSLYNHFILSPLNSAVIIFITLPVFITIIFQKSEDSLRKWLEVEFDTEAKLIAEIRNGTFSSTKAGSYIVSIKNRFRPEIIVDIVCFVRVYLELSIRAKSVLLMKEAGFEIAKDDSVEEKLKEFSYLQKSIGKTGKLALAPVFRFKSKDIWKINLLK